MLERHREQAMAAVQRATVDASEAEDCVQEALLRLALRNDLDPSRVRSLLTRTAMGIAIDRLRARGRAERLAIRLGGGMAAQTVSPEQVAGDRADLRRAFLAISSLPWSERRVLLLRVSGMSIAETARHLGVTQKSVEGAFTRARARLRILVGGALAWVAARLRRAPSQSGEAIAAAVAVLLFVSPLWHHDGAGGVGPRGAAPQTLRTAPAFSAQGGTRAPATAGPLPGVLALRARPGGSANDGGERGRQTAPMVIGTGSIRVNPPPSDQGTVPPIYFGGVGITWGPNQSIDPVNGIEKCLQQGGPEISLSHGGCNT